MQPFVHLVSSILNRLHIIFFFGKVFERIAFKIFDSFLTEQLVVIRILLQFCHPPHNGKQFFVCVVNQIHADIQAVVPFHDSH